MIFGTGLTRTKSSIFSATSFSREDPKIAREGSSSISVRRSPTRRRRPCGTPFGAGICLSAVTKLSKTCHGCSTRLSGAGSNITGGTIAPHFIRRCAHWIEILPFGPSANTRSCANICAERRTGSPVFRGALRRCSQPGRWGCGVAPCWELYESRGSRTVLREPRGAIPRGYSPSTRVGRRRQPLHQFIEKSLALIKGLNAHTFVAAMEADIVAVHKKALYPIARDARRSQIGTIGCAHYHDRYDRDAGPEFVGELARRIEKVRTKR